MAVVAFVSSTSWNQSVLQHAAWAAITLNEPLVLAAREATADSEPPMGLDAYGGMDVREEMFREMRSRERTELPKPDDAALELVQASARIARDLGVKSVRTVTTPDPAPVFIEQSTDSGDLLVLPRLDTTANGIRTTLDQFLRCRRRMMLLVPEQFSPIDTWLIAIDGKPASGRAVDFLTRNPLLQDKAGMAVYVGNDYQNRLHFRDAVKHLESAHHKVASHELQGGTDDVLTAVLAVSPVDLLVMGAYGQGRFRSLLEGSTTSRMLKAFGGPVLIARD